MVNTIRAYDRISDVDVIMSTINPQPRVGLGNILVMNTLPAPTQGETPVALSDTLTAEEIRDGLILRKTDKATGAIYREYRNLDAVKTDYSANADVVAKAEAYFAQDNHSDRVAIVDLPNGKELEALGAFWYFNWTFGILAKSDDNKPLLTTISNIFEANQDHLFVYETHDPLVYQALQGQGFTISLYHDVAEPMAAPFVGENATKEVGSITWKFKHLNGVTPESLTVNELKTINKGNAIAYTTVLGRDQTTEGKVASGEYIDTVHGIIWVKNEMQARLQKLLQDNDKIPYDQTGINMILAVANGVLNQAYEQGIIQTDKNGKADFTISAKPREEQSAQDLSDRRYGGIQFSYHAAGAVHSLVIHGEINSDTILQ